MKQPGDNKRAIGYIRVSTEEQANGPEAQRAEIRRWCAANKAELVATFEDIGVSGGAPVDKRAGLLEAIGALRSHGAGLLVVAKRDRLARDVVAAAMIERLTERAGARVVAANGAGNDDGPEGLLLRRMLDAFAEYERALIRARTRSALAVKRARRERTGAVPYGWSLARDGTHLEPEPKEQATAKAARAMRDAGLTLRAVAAELERRGLRPRHGGRWHPETIRGLLRSEAA